MRRNPRSFIDTFDNYALALAWIYTVFLIVWLVTGLDGAISHMTLISSSFFTFGGFYLIRPYVEDMLTTMQARHGEPERSGDVSKTDAVTSDNSNVGSQSGDSTDVIDGISLARFWLDFFTTFFGVATLSIAVWQQAIMMHNTDSRLWVMVLPLPFLGMAVLAFSGRFVAWRISDYVRQPRTFIEVLQLRITTGAPLVNLLWRVLISSSSLVLLVTIIKPLKGNWGTLSSVETGTLIFTIVIGILIFLGRWMLLRRLK